MRRPTLWPRPGLWRHRDFLRLWAAQAVSLGGTQVTALALPTVAILALHATPVEVGALSALQWLGLPGRRPRRWRGRGPPPASAHHGRRRPRAVARARLRARGVRARAAGAGPPLCGRGGHERLHRLLRRGLSVLPARPGGARPPGRGQRQAGPGRRRGAARVGGPALGGVLIQVVGGATAIAADAASYLASALCLASIRAPEPRPAAGAGETSIFAEMREGIAAVVHQPDRQRCALP